MYSSVKRILIFRVGKTNVSNVFEDVMWHKVSKVAVSPSFKLFMKLEECGKKSPPCLFPKYIFLNVQKQEVLKSNIGLLV